MAEVVMFEPGGYRYIKGVFQYSGGVAAENGYAIVRARLARPLPLAEGFSTIEAYLQSVGRTTTAFCACELRTPEPFTEQEFVAFNRQYVETLERWGIYRDGMNPVARTNVCPEFDKPSVPSLYAFSYTVPRESVRGSFIISGSAEAREGGVSYGDSIVLRGDVSAGALREKVRFVVAEMEARLTALGFEWQDAVSTQAYSVHDIGPIVRDEIFAKGAAPGGLERHFSRPPVVDLEYEMDVRGADTETLI